MTGLFPIVFLIVVFGVCCFTSGAMWGTAKCQKRQEDAKDSEMKAILLATQSAELTISLASIMEEQGFKMPEEATQALDNIAKRSQELRQEYAEYVFQI